MARRRVIANAHIYVVGDDFYIPTVVKEASGAWVEVLPVASGRIHDREALVRALEGARAASGPAVEGQVPWDGGGRVWDRAEHFLALYWLDDGTLKLAPKVMLPVETDPETGDVLAGGWVDDKARTGTFPGDASMTTISDALVTTIAEKNDG